jgi:hypothetical protein
MRAALNTQVNFLHHDKACRQDKVNGVASLRTGALFFARHLDNFIVTQS